MTADDFEVVIQYLETVNDFIKNCMSQEMNDYLISQNIQNISPQQPENDENSNTIEATAEQTTTTIILRKKKGGRT